MKTVVTAEEAGGVLSLSRRTVCRRCAEGHFHGAYREGLRWRIPVDALEAYITAKQLEKKKEEDNIGEK